MIIRSIADAVGRGLVAGLAGTAAMTVSSTIEAKVNKRGSSSTPADAAGKVAGVEPTEQGEERFNNLVHWSYGTGWGAVRGLIGLVGLRGPVASLAHLGAVWGAEQVVLPTLDVGSPVWKYGPTAVGIDALHHVVYAAATGAVYDWLDTR
ncbi:MAG TPA: hypothetical protein VFJ14_11075 [Nocardioidaceae bacterium]|nr:hypothetical protein [Nocardioidaceae bacterium]